MDTRRISEYDFRYFSPTGPGKRVAGSCTAVCRQFLGLHLVPAQLLTDEVVTGLEWLGGGLIMLGAYWSARSSEETAKNTGVVT